MSTLSFKDFFATNFAYIKNEFIVFIAALIAPTTEMLIMIGILIVADTASGIYAAIKTRGWDGFKSRIMSDGILPKLIFYPMAILIAQAMESQFPDIPIMKTTGFLLMSIEARSISENYKIIFGISIFNSFKTLFNSELREALKESTKEEGK